jgi:hypothetical protein
VSVALKAFGLRIFNHWVFAFIHFANRVITLFDNRQFSPARTPPYTPPSPELAAKLFVIAPATEHTHFAGIPHAHAIRGIDGSAVFCFRQLAPAVHLAQAVDHRMITNPANTFTEDLVEPYSNLCIGQIVDIKHDFDPDEHLHNVIIGHVSEQEMSKYAQATQISVIILDKTDDHLVIADIICPPKNLMSTAKYLDYIFEEK